MFIFKVTVVLYFIKILSSSRNFYRLRMTSLTSTNVFTISCLSIEPPPPPAPVNLVLQHWCKALQSLYCTIRRLFVLFVAYSRTIRGLFVLFVDYSRTIRTIRRLFADYSYYSSTIRGLFVDYSIRGLFVLFVDYSRTIRTIRRLFALFVDYSLHYSSFINCQ